LIQKGGGGVEIAFKKIFKNNLKINFKLAFTSAFLEKMPIIATMLAKVAAPVFILAADVAQWLSEKNLKKKKKKRMIKILCSMPGPSKH